MKYVALLRGINVGGNNIIKMAELKLCFEHMGMQDVVTYIQSGNVIFSSSEENIEKLTSTIERELSKKFNYASRVLVITDAMLKKTVAEVPSGFGQQPDVYRYDVIFTKPPLTPKAAIKEISTKEGVDDVHSGTHAVYFSRLISRATQSHLPKIIKLPLYQNVTVRNWNTTTKLLAMMYEKE